jgi:hypothetical protein
MNGDETSRPEAAMVLMLLQATFWFGAGLSAFPFVLGGEVWMVALGFVSIALAAAAVGLGVAVLRRRARRWAIALEVACVVGSLLLLALPIGANRAPVSLLVNVALPLGVVLLLGGRRMARHFGIARAVAR